MLGCEIPLTPDQGEARDWLLEELSKGVYGEISGPIVSFVSDLIDDFFRLLSWRGEGTPPISLILTILAIIAIAALVVVLILLLVQVAFASHVRTMSVSAASEGARRGGLLGGDEEEAVARTSELLDSLVGASRDREIEVEREPDGDTDVLVVTVRTRLPLEKGRKEWEELCLVF